MILCFMIVGLFFLLKTSLDNDDECPPKFDSRDVKCYFPPPQIYLCIEEEIQNMCCVFLTRHLENRARSLQMFTIETPTI